MSALARSLKRARSVPARPTATCMVPPSPAKSTPTPRTQRVYRPADVHPPSRLAIVSNHQPSLLRAALRHIVPNLRAAFNDTMSIGQPSADESTGRNERTYGYTPPV
ncbi:hypothetical protein B0H14DRAFT_3513283 [Mycena olivaceomarginata]|nr:hypothetical protein B0H14DRAFT_3513283 [Mycena olivaceomarginata]